MKAVDTAAFRTRTEPVRGMSSVIPDLLTVTTALKHPVSDVIQRKYDAAYSVETSAKMRVDLNGQQAAPSN